MQIADFLDKGASLDPAAPCFTTDGASMSYRQVVDLSHAVAAALARRGVRPGDKVAILSGNDPTAFGAVFGVSRAGAVWCPINPRNEAAENRALLDGFDCVALLYQPSFAPLVAAIRASLPRIHTWVCFGDGYPDTMSDALSWPEFIGHTAQPDPGADTAAPALDDARGAAGEPIGDLAMIAGTGGTTGTPKGVMLTGTNLETMASLTLMSYPFDGRPVYLALAPLTHAAGVLCFPILCLGGEIVIMRKPDVEDFLRHLQRHRVTHTFLPPTLLYMVLAHPALERADLSALQCFWYGAAPMSPARLEEALIRIGPVMAQLFGQTEAPMMVSTMSPREHFLPDGSVATQRLSSAGRPTPLVTLAIMDNHGTQVPRGERGEIVLRSSLVTPGYYRNPTATAEASKFGWHHTGDIGYLDDEGFLFIVDRAKDIIITGGFNVYSVEVEQALLAHPDIQDCAVIGRPDDKWGERVEAVVQPRSGRSPDPQDVIAFVKARIGSVKTPKVVHVWPDLPRSKVGKVLKPEVKVQLSAQP